MSLLLILAQAAAPPPKPPPSPPQSISILANPCPAPVGDEVVVCAAGPAARLPLPDERRAPGEIVHYKGEATSGADPGACALMGCQVGVDMIGMGVAAVRLVGKLIDPNSCCDEPGQATKPGALLRDVARGLRRKPDKSNRVAIDLDAPPPPGRLLP